MSEFDGAIAAVRAAAQRLRADLGDDPAGRLVAGAMPYLSAPPLRVVAWGGADRGKSALLAALAGDPEAFPHHKDDTTTVVSSLAWARTRAAVVRRVPAAGGRPEEVAIDAGELRDYVTGPASRDRATLEVSLTAPLEALRPGLVLIDTPAVDSRFSGANLAAQRHLARADVVLVVASPDRPLTDPEMASLRLVPGRVRVLGVFAKADRAAKAKVYDDARRKLAAALRGPVPLFPVSARLADGGPDQNESQDESQDESMVPDLLRRLVLLATAQQAATAAGAERILDDALDGLAERPARLLEALRKAESDERVLQQEIDRVNADIAAVGEWADRQRAELRGQTAGAFADIRAHVDAQCAAMRERAALTRESPQEPEEYEQEFVTDLARIADEADARRAAFVAGVIETVQALTRAELASPEPGDPLYSVRRLDRRPLPDRRPGLSFAAIRAGLETSAKTAVTAGAFGASVGAALGTVTGLVGAPVAAGVGSVVGALLGQVFGLIGGTREGIREAQEQFRITTLRSLADLAPGRIAEVAGDMRDTLTALEPGTLKALLGTLKAAVAQRLGQLQAVADGLEQQRSADPAERAARIAELEAQLAGYARLRDELTGGLAALRRIAVDHVREALTP